MEDVKSEAVIGIEIESWVGHEMDERSVGFLGQSSMNWRTECWDSVKESEGLCEGLSKESE